MKNQNQSSQVRLDSKQYNSNKERCNLAVFKVFFIAISTKRIVYMSSF